MIDIKTYLDKLEALKNYVYTRIDNQPHEIWIDLQVCPNTYYHKKALPLPTPYKKMVRHCFGSFAEYYHSLVFRKISEEAENYLILQNKTNQ